MLLEKYEPESLLEIVGQKSFTKKIEDWLDNRKKGEALLIYGPHGTGKSLIPRLIAKKRNLSVFEINASDKRSSLQLKETLRPASKEGSLLRKRLILIDDVDNMGRSDKGGLAEVIKAIRESSFPIIITAKNAYDPKIRNLRNYCKLLKITRIRKDMIRSKITQIAKNEKLKINFNVINSIAENSDGDIRSAINDLEIASSLDSIGYRESEKDIFETIRTIFKSQDLSKVTRTIRNCDKNIDEILWWVEQNIPNEYEDPREIAVAFEFLSKADMFKAKLFKTRNYRLMIYITNMIAAVSLAKRGPYRKFVSYKPPDRLIMLGRSKAKRNKMDEVYGILGQQLHCSKRKVKEQLPFLKIILNEEYTKLSNGV